jgi:hypothetical protein
LRRGELRFLAGWITLIGLALVLGFLGASTLLVAVAMLIAFLIFLTLEARSSQLQSRRRPEGFEAVCLIAAIALLLGAAVVAAPFWLMLLLIVGAGAAFALSRRVRRSDGL